MSTGGAAFLPRQLPTSAVVDICGVSALRLSQLVREGKVTRGDAKPGFYPPTVISEYIQWLKDRLDAKPNEDHKPEKAFRHFRAIQARLQAEEMAGELVRVEKVEAALAQRVTRAVTRLNAIPDAACAVFSELLGEAADDAIAEVRQLIQARINEACVQLADMGDDDLEEIAPDVEPYDPSKDDDGSEEDEGS